MISPGFEAGLAGSSEECERIPRWLKAILGLQHLVEQLLHEAMLDTVPELH